RRLLRIIHQLHDHLAGLLSRIRRHSVVSEFHKLTGIRSFTINRRMSCANVSGSVTASPNSITRPFPTVYVTECPLVFAPESETQGYAPGKFTSTTTPPRSAN